MEPAHKLRIWNDWCKRFVQLFLELAPCDRGEVDIESLHVETMVDGKTERLPTRTKISGSLTGHGVPLDTVRSLSNLIGLLARTFFGA